MRRFHGYGDGLKLLIIELGRILCIEHGVTASKLSDTLAATLDNLIRDRDKEEIRRILEKLKENGKLSWQHYNTLRSAANETIEGKAIAGHSPQEHIDDRRIEGLYGNISATPKSAENPMNPNVHSNRHNVTPLENMLQKEEITEVVECVKRSVEKYKKLDPENGKVIEDYYFGEKTQQQIADEMKISQAAVSGRIKTAEKYFRKDLKRLRVFSMMCLRLKLVNEVQPDFDRRCLRFGFMRHLVTAFAVIAAKGVKVPCHYRNASPMSKRIITHCRVIGGQRMMLAILHGRFNEQETRALIGWFFADIYRIGKLAAAASVARYKVPQTDDFLWWAIAHNPELVRRLLSYCQ